MVYYSQISQTTCLSLGIFGDQFVKTNRDTYVTFYDRSASNILKFQTLLKNNNWSDIQGNDDPNYTYANFHTDFMCIYNASFPLKKIKAARYKRNKPWLSNGILKSIKKKNVLCKKSLRYPTLENINKYKKYKNKLNHVQRTAKRSYYQKRIKSSKSNIKATWNIINEILNKKKRNASMPSIFIDNVSNISDPLRIANRFCDYFFNIGHNLSKKIPSSKRTPTSYLSGNYSNFAFDEPVAESEVVSVIGSLTIRNHG